jgi:hypothetical protein
MGIEDYTDITPDAPKWLVARARGGNRDAALRILELFSYAVAKGETPCIDILAYLAECFDKIVDAADSNKATAAALNLTRPRHRMRDKGRDERDEALAIAVHDLILQGKTVDAAVIEVSEVHKKFTEDTVRHAWRMFKDSPLIQEPDPIPDRSGGK